MSALQYDLGLVFAADKTDQVPRGFGRNNMVMLSSDVQERHTNLTEIDRASCQSEFVPYQLILSYELGNKLARRFPGEGNLIGGPALKAQVGFDKRLILDVVEQLQPPRRLLEWAQH